MQTDPNQFLMSSGVKSFKFGTIGATVKGTIVSLDMQQQRDLKSNAPKFWDKEETQPMLQLRIVLQTDEREGDNDDGQRAIYAKGNMQNAVRDAIKKAEATKIDVGGTLAVKYEKDGDKTNPAFDPPKEYVAQYKPPVESTTSVSADELL